MSGVPREGDVLAGKYRVERILGQGGMGVVVQAHHVQLDERVAMKFLLPEYAAHAEASARFLREARAAVKIKSEHVARVVDVGNLETGAPYMVMEYLEGSDLSSILQTRGPLPVDEAVEYLLQACEALAEAHAAGIVHRDLKPANLFLTRRADGSAVVKVLDFGISKVVTKSDSGGALDASLTKTSAMMGSPLYMSPEQMRSARDVDARADLWAIGAILYELVTGRPPFMGDSLPQICAAILAETPVSVLSLRPELPPSLDPVIMGCLAKDPAHRYRTVADLGVALLAFSPRRGRTSVERISKVITAAGLSESDLAIPAHVQTERPPPPSATQAAWGQTGGGSNAKNRAPIAIALAALFGVLVIGGGAAAFGYKRFVRPRADAPVLTEPTPEPALAAITPPRESPVAPTVEPVAAPPPPSASPAAESPGAPPSASPRAEARAAREAARAGAAPKPGKRAPGEGAAPAAAPKETKPKSRAVVFGDRQ